MKSTSEILSLLRRYKPTAQKKYGMTKLGVFGSVARGEQKPGSDVDICYEGKAPSLLTLDLIKTELEQLLESEVDLTRQIAQSDKELVDLDKQIEKLVGIVSALRSRNCGIKIDVNNQSPPSALNDANKNEIGEAENLEGKVGEIIFDAFEWAEDADDIYLGEDIPDDKLDNATEKMQPLEDSVFILLDSTVFGSAEEGMILTSKAAYFKNLFEDPVRFTWSELSEAKYTEDGEVVVGEYSFASGKNEDFANNLASSLCCIAHQLKDLGLVPVGGVRNNNPQIIKCPNCGVDVHVSSKNCWSCDYELH